jgi:hypothetical protein
MASLESLIAGLAEAEARYRDRQLEAFLGVEPLLDGVVSLRPLTPQMHIELSAAGNLCVTSSSAPRPQDILQFLWRCSEAFDRNDRKKRSQFFKVCSLLNYIKVVEEIDQYLIRSWSGQPLWLSSGGVKTAGVWPSMIVHVIAGKYGWSEEQILNTPFRRLWQYLQRVFEDTIPDYRHRCPEADALRAKWLREQNGEGRN